MPSYFRPSRNVELSLLQYLTTNLTTDWPGTTLAKTFKQVQAKNVDLPIVLVRLSDVQSTRREIGSTTLQDSHLLIIDIFSRNEGERLDMSDYIKNLLKDSWVHYIWSRPSGNPTTMDKTASGRDFVNTFILDQKIDIGQSVDTKDKYRHSISIRVTTPEV